MTTAQDARPAATATTTAAGGATAEAAARVRRYRVAAVVLVVVTGLWRLVIMTSWSWIHDDWTLVQLAHRLPFLEFVTTVYNDHLQPGQMAFYWVATRLAPLDFTTAAVMLWVVSMAALVAWLLMLRSLLGRRLAAVLAALPVALAPGFTPTGVWLVAALAVFTLQLFIALTVWVSLPWVRRGSKRHLVGTVAVFALSLVFWQKNLLVVIPVLGVALLLARGVDGRLLRGRMAWLTTLLAAASVAYVVIYLIATPSTTGQFSPRGPGDSLEFGWSLLVQDVLQAALLGPHLVASTSPSGYPVPSTAGQWLVAAAAVGLLVWGLSRRRRGWIPVTTALIYAVVSGGLFLLSGRSGLAGLFGAVEFRYFADIVAVAVLMGALLLVPAAGEPVPWRAGAGQVRVAWWVAPTVFAGGLAVAMAGSASAWDAVRPLSPKPYVDTLVASARAAGTASVHDAAAPPAIINAYWAGPNAFIRSMLEPLGLPLRWDQPAEQVLVADATGNLVPAAVQPGVSGRPGPVADCGWLVQPGERTTIPLENKLFDFGWAVQLDYYSRDGGTATVSAGRSKQSVTFAPGLSQRQLYVEGPVEKVVLVGRAGSAPVCVTAVTVGTFVPAQGPMPAAAAGIPAS